VIEIKTEISKALKEGAAEEVARAEASLAANLIAALLERIKARVSGAGDTAGQRVPDWDDSYRPRPVSASYPDNTGQEVGRRGAKWFKTWKEFHTANRTRRGSYKVTGGMWAGLSRVISTPTLTHGQFRGRSPGADPRFINGESRPLRINNVLKAWTVLTKHGVNVLAFSDEELEGVRDGAVVTLGAAIAKAWDVGWEGNLSVSSQFGDGAILDIFRSKLRR
jgi:hypothetical protein